MTAKIISFPPERQTVADDQRIEQVNWIVLQLSARLGELSRLEPKRWTELAGYVIAVVMKTRTDEEPMRRITHAPPPKPKKKAASVPKLAKVIVKARTNKQIAKAKRLARSLDPNCP